MIASISIKDFQSHVDTTINFAPDGQLTVIVGPSDSGKTAAFRALRWVAYNEPAGIDYIRVGATKARVSINMADGRTVTRERSKSANRYTIIEPGQDNVILEGFGTSVPLEVQQVLGIVPVQIGEMNFNLNLAEQLQGPFLGGSIPATQKAKVLGKLAGTEEVDLASKQLGTDLYRRRQAEKQYRQDVADLEDTISRYDYLEPLGETIDTVSALLTEVKAADARKTRLERLRTELQGLDTQIRTVKGRINTLSMTLIVAEPLVAKTERSAGRHRRLIDVAGRLGLVDSGLQAIAVTLERTKYVDYTADLIQSTSYPIPNLARMIVLRDQLSRVDDQLKTANETIWNTAHAETLSTTLDLSLVDAATLSRLRKLHTDLQVIEPGLRRAEDVLVATGRVDETAWLASEAGKDLLRRIRLAELQVRLQAVEFTQGESDGKATALGMAIDKAEALMADAGLRVKSLVRLAAAANNLRTVQTGINANILTLTDVERGFTAAQREYGEVLQAMGTCPTCGVDTKKMQLKEVV